LYLPHALLVPAKSKLTGFAFRNMPSALSGHQLHVHLMQAAGDEDLLLDEFEGLGLHCDPQTQLVVTCEVCCRPATKECWTCGMKICEFCTLKRHWKVGLHPVGHRLANASKQ